MKFILKIGEVFDGSSITAFLSLETIGRSINLG